MPDLPSYLYFTTISDADAYELGFDFASLGEFDLEKDIATLERILTGLGVEPRRLSYGARLAHDLVRLSPPLLWNLNSGIVGYTREAQVPALCEMLQIPLIGPGAWTAFVTQDKSMACSWVAQSGLPVAVADHVLIGGDADLGRLARLPRGVSYIVKPNHDESSRGLSDDSVQSDPVRLADQVQRTIAAWGPVRVERFIPGINISANLACEASGRLIALEPIFVEVPTLVDTGLTKLNHQRTITPVAERDPELAARIRALVLDLGRLFAFRHYARFDLRLDTTTGQLYFLEANICPSFEPNDDYVIAAGLGGISFEELVRRFVVAAWSDAKRGRFAEAPAMIRDRLAQAQPAALLRSVGA